MKRFLLILFVSLIAVSCTKEPVNPATAPYFTLETTTPEVNITLTYAGDTSVNTFDQLWVYYIKDTFTARYAIPNRSGNKIYHYTLGANLIYCNLMRGKSDTDGHITWTTISNFTM